MSYIQGEGRSQETLFPVVLDDLIPSDHVCRVLDAFVAGLPMAELGFERFGSRRNRSPWIRSTRSSQALSVWLPPSATEAAQVSRAGSRLLRIVGGISPGYNLQTAVDAKHALIVTHPVTLDAADYLCLLPMAEAASEALGRPATLNVIADTGYSNGEHASRCEEIGIVTHVPAKRSVNPHGLFDRSAFNYQTESDIFICPEGKTLTRKQLNRPMRSIRYEAAVKDRRACPSRTLCTKSAWRVVSRSIDDDALNRMNARATPAAMRLRRPRSSIPSEQSSTASSGILACYCEAWQALRRKLASPSWLTTSNASSK